MFRSILHRADSVLRWFGVEIRYTPTTKELYVPQDWVKDYEEITIQPDN